MSSRIRDASASEVATAHSPTDAETTTTTPRGDAATDGTLRIDSAADRTRVYRSRSFDRNRVHGDGSLHGDRAGRRRWSR